MEFTCPTCGQPVEMRSQGPGMYGSKPVFVYVEHDRDGAECPASTLTDAEAREL
jgi:hypothetical protein